MNQFRTSIRGMDHKGYPAYKSLKGTYQFKNYQLEILHVQGDPFASPSSVAVKINGRNAAFPKEYYQQKHRRIAMEDYLLRNFSTALDRGSHRAKGSGKSGMIAASHPGQEILERTGCRVSQDGSVLFRFVVGFPARGRTIDAREMEKIFFDILPPVVEQCGFYATCDKERIEETIALADDQYEIRRQLVQKGLVAFVADGSVLPRESGISERPMKDAIAFKSPESLRVTLDLPHRGKISGMGIREGITLIVGGGYHGKSTLLKTLEKSVYPHIAGDGREYVATLDCAMKIRAEDGRSVCNEDISLFIKDLPNGKDTTHFSTLDASGSTSQAANTIEAIEAGSSLLLIDEDTSATNFMIRDKLMEQVIAPGEEPIIPFIKRIRPLYEEQKVSTILVVGSCGAFFEMADTIIQMEQYLPRDITKRAKSVFDANSDRIRLDDELVLPKGRTIRIPKATERNKIKVMGTDGFSLQHHPVDLRYLEQITDGEQMLALAQILCYTLENFGQKQIAVPEYLDQIMSLLEQKGLEGLISGKTIPNMAMPRKNEIAGCLNRYVR